MQINFPINSLEVTQQPMIKKALENLKNGLVYGEWAPTFTNVNTPDGETRCVYQVCGRVCIFHIRMEYVSTNPSWTATPYLTLPIQADTTISGTGLNVGVYPVYNYTTPALIGYAKENTSSGTRLQLPTYAPGAASSVVIQGFYWIR